MSNIFDIKRFWNFLLYDLRRARNNYALSMLLLGLTPVILYMIIQFFSLIFGNGVAEIPDSLKIMVMAVSCVIIILGFGSKVYGQLTEKRAGSDYLMIPASTTEKWISLFLVTCVAAPVVLGVLLLASDGLMSLLFPNSYGTRVLDMTKINEVGLKSDLAVILDMAADKYPTEQLLSINDGIVETAASLLMTAEKRDIDCVLLYPDKEKQVRTLFPKTQQDYAELIKRMVPITPNPKNGFLDAQEILSQEMEGANKRANLLVVTSRVTDGLLDTLTTIRGQQRNPLLFCVMPTNVTANERKEIQARFLGLDDAGIPYRVLTAADAERRDEV